MRTSIGLQHLYADWRLNTEESVVEALREGKEILRQDVVVYNTYGQMIPSPLLGERVGFIQLAGRLEDAKIQFRMAEGLRGQLSTMAQNTSDHVAVCLKATCQLPQHEPVQVRLVRQLKWQRNGDLVYTETPSVMVRRRHSFDAHVFRHVNVVIGNRPRSFLARCLLALKGF